MPEKKIVRLGHVRRSHNIAVPLQQVEPSDIEKRCSFYRTGFADGKMTVNQIRAAEGLPPLPTEEASDGL